MAAQPDQHGTRGPYTEAYIGPFGSFPWTGQRQLDLSIARSKRKTGLVSLQDPNPVVRRTLMNYDHEIKCQLPAEYCDETDLDCSQ